MTNEKYLQELQQKLETAKSEYNTARKESDRLFKIKYDIEKEIEKINFKLKKYITDLSPYNGKTLRNIVPIDSNGERVWIPDDESVWVENNRLVCSSYENGLLNFDEEKQKYIHSYRYREEELDIVGFRDIIVEDED
mgnify:CR=1 FL=1